MLSRLADLGKSKEFIKFFTSFTRVGSMNIDDLTLLRRYSLSASGLTDLNLTARFSPNVRKAFLKLFQNWLLFGYWVILKWAKSIFSEIFGPVASYKVVSQAGLFGSGSGLKLTKSSGLILAWDWLFVLGAQKHNQNNLVTLLNFSDIT